MGEWELVSLTKDNLDHEVGRTERLAVPGGWLYRVVLRGSVALQFVPHDHSYPKPWDI